AAALAGRAGGGAVHTGVEAFVPTHPSPYLSPVVAPLASPPPRPGRQLPEPPLRGFQLGDSLAGDPRRRELGREALQLRSNEERLAELLARDRAHAYASIRHERDEPERGEPSERLAYGRPADCEPLRELLLAENAAGRDLARHDRLLERERNVVRFRAGRHHDGSLVPPRSRPQRAGIQMCPQLQLTGSSWTSSCPCATDRLAPPQPHTGQASLPHSACPSPSTRQPGSSQCWSPTPPSSSRTLIWAQPIATAVMLPP